MILDFGLRPRKQAYEPMSFEILFRESKIDNPKPVLSYVELFKMAGLSVIALMLVVIGAEADAQQPTKVPRIGYLFNTSLYAAAFRVEAFRQGMRELGYVEGKNIVIEFRYSEAEIDRLHGLVAELVRLKVNLIVAS